MGVGGNNVSHKERKDIIPTYYASLFISISKIKEIEDFFKSSKETKKLSSFFSSLIQEYNINEKTKEFNQIIKDAKISTDVYSIMKYILDTLHSELNKKKKEKNYTHFLSYIEFMDNFNKNNNSIITNLFLEVKQKNLFCNKCSNNSSEVFETCFIEKYILPDKKEIDIRNLIKGLEGKKKFLQKMQ